LVGLRDFGAAVGDQHRHRAEDRDEETQGEQGLQYPLPPRAATPRATGAAARGAGAVPAGWSVAHSGPPCESVLGPSCTYTGPEAVVDDRLAGWRTIYRCDISGRWSSPPASARLGPWSLRARRGGMA